MNTKKISILFSSSFGIGNLKFFPGTLASFATLPMVWFIKDFFSFNLFLIILILYSVISYFLIKICIKNLTNKDPKYIVADEHIGQSISLIFCDQKILHELNQKVIERFGSTSFSGLIWKSQNDITVSKDKAETLFKLLSMLEENEDVQVVSSNFDVNEDVLTSLTA